ncbi:MAG: hypothetical protein IJ214_02720 [Clostridia bacterium]|nr:hypothetical protein [Clostridia bacterium]
MKKLLGILLALCLLGTLAFAAAEGAHEHVWGEWLPSDGGHTAECAEDGDTLTVRHHTFSTGTISGSAVCAMCGQYRDGVFPLIEGAEAVSQKAEPSTQRGIFVARGMETPYADAENVVYAFTVAYVHNGALATWKDVSTVSLPLDVELPENYQLIRITPAAGDDSVQNPERQIEMESAWEDGVLSFTTKTPALYLIVTTN